MSIIEIDTTQERIARVVASRVARAKRLHPEEKTFLERLDTVQAEIDEVREALERGDHAHAMYEYGDVGATLSRGMEELERFAGVRIG